MIEGIDSLTSKLNMLATKVIEENAVKVCSNGIKIVQASAKLNCPVNDGELRQSIKTAVRKTDTGAIAECYTNKEHGMYVEFGTGKKGDESHSGISPSVNVAYTLDPWWIHESMVDKKTAEKYKWFSIETKDGIFYQVTGQAAQPFMYPAIRDNEKRIKKNMGNYLSRKIREEAGK